MRSRLPLVLAIAAVVLGMLLIVPATYEKLTGSDSGSSTRWAAPAGITPSAPPPPTLAAAPVTVRGVDGFFSWALIDEQGKISGSENLTATTWAGSIVKAWIVADFLRNTAEQGGQAGGQTQAGQQQTGIQSETSQQQTGNQGTQGGSQVRDAGKETAGHPETGTQDKETQSQKPNVKSMDTQADLKTEKDKKEKKSRKQKRMDKRNKDRN